METDKKAAHKKSSVCWIVTELVSYRDSSSLGGIRIEQPSWGLQKKYK